MNDEKITKSRSHINYKILDRTKEGKKRYYIRTLCMFNNMILQGIIRRMRGVRDKNFTLPPLSIKMKQQYWDPRNYQITTTSNVVYRIKPWDNSR